MGTFRLMIVMITRYRTYDGRLVGRLDFPLLDLVPVDATEERVVLDVAVARRAAA